MRLGGLLVDRREALARTAPRRPEVDDHHRILVYGLLEVFLGQLYGRHVSPRKKWAVYPQCPHVRRSVRPVADGAFALRLARRRGRELARRPRGRWPLARAHRGPRWSALRAGRGRRNPPYPGSPRPRLGRRNRLPEQATFHIWRRPETVARAGLLVQLLTPRDCRLLARPRFRWRADLSRHLPHRGTEDRPFVTPANGGSNPLSRPRTRRHRPRPGARRRRLRALSRRRHVRVSARGCSR